MAKDRQTIVVCGATGNQGRAVVRSLQGDGRWSIVALSRDPGSESAWRLAASGVEVHKADLQDVLSLLRAFEGAHGVFGVTQPWSPDYRKCDVGAEVAQGKNIVDASNQDCVEHVVLSTVLHFNRKRTGVPHVDSKLEIEEYALEKNLPHTLIKCASFMDNIGASYFPVKKGSVRGLADGDAKVPYVACADIGYCAAIAFARPDEYLGKEINLVGDFVSGQDLCDILSKLRNGEHFRYKTIPKIVMRLFAAEFYKMRLTFEAWGRQPYPTEIMDALNACRRINPKMMSVEQYLKSVSYDSKELSR